MTYPRKTDWRVNPIRVKFGNGPATYWCPFHHADFGKSHPCFNFREQTRLPISEVESGPHDEKDSLFRH